MRTVSPLRPLLWVLLSGAVLWTEGSTGEESSPTTEPPDDPSMRKTSPLMPTTQHKRTLAAKGRNLSGADLSALAALNALNISTESVPRYRKRRPTTEMPLPLTVDAWTLAGLRSTPRTGPRLQGSVKPIIPWSTVLHRPPTQPTPTADLSPTPQLPVEKQSISSSTPSLKDSSEKSSTSAESSESMSIPSMPTVPTGLDSIIVANLSEEITKTFERNTTQPNNTISSITFPSVPDLGVTLLPKGTESVPNITLPTGSTRSVESTSLEGISLASGNTPAPTIKTSESSGEADEATDTVREDPVTEKPLAVVVIPPLSTVNTSTNSLDSDLPENDILASSHVAVNTPVLAQSNDTIKNVITEEDIRKSPPDPLDGTSDLENVIKLEGAIKLSTPSPEKENKIPEKISTSLPEKENKIMEISTPSSEKENKIPEISTPSSEKENKIPEISTPSSEKENKIPEIPTPSSEKENKIPEISTPSSEKENKIPEISTPFPEKKNKILEISTSLPEKENKILEISTSPPDKENKIPEIEIKESSISNSVNDLPEESPIGKPEESKSNPSQNISLLPTQDDKNISVLSTQSKTEPPKKEPKEGVSVVSPSVSIPTETSTENSTFSSTLNVKDFYNVSPAPDDSAVLDFNTHQSNSTSSTAEPTSHHSFVSENLSEVKVIPLESIFKNYTTSPEKEYNDVFQEPESKESSTEKVESSYDETSNGTTKNEEEQNTIQPGEIAKPYPVLNLTDVTTHIEAVKKELNLTTPRVEQTSTAKEMKPKGEVESEEDLSNTWLPPVKDSEEGFSEEGSEDKVEKPVTRPTPDTTTSPPRTSLRPTSPPDIRLRPTTKVNESEEETVYEPPTPMYTRLLIQADDKSLCAKKEQLRDSILKLFKSDQREVTRKQVVIQNLSGKECEGSSGAGEDGLTAVQVYLTSPEGHYDNTLTDTFIILWHRQGLDFSYPVKRVDKVYATRNWLEMSSDQDTNPSVIAAIIISSIAGVCLIFITILLVIIRKRQTGFNYGQRCTPVSLEDYSLDNISVYNSVRRKAARASKRSYGNPAFDDPGAISRVLNFATLANFVTNRAQMDEEFSQIPVVTVKPDELPPGVEHKNRFANVIPLPETRVHLKSEKAPPDDKDDYINANFVKGGKGEEKFYIACQAPMAETISDFWQMVWHQQSRLIVMLTELQEGGVEKSADYLPPSEVLDCHRVFGDLQVTLKKREVRENYVISSLQLKNLETNLWREVVHMWYVTWPHHGVPQEPSAVIALLIEARSYVKSKEHSAPIVVHCSPGTGRTGTVIAIDMAIRDFEVKRSIDIPRTVYNVRKDRAGAVQTKDQYAFIYQVLQLYATKLTGGGLDSI